MPELKYLQGAVSVLKWTILYPIDPKNSPLKKIFYSIWALLFISSFVTTVIQCVMFLLTTEFDLVKEALVVMNSAIYISLFINFLIFYYKSKNLVKLVANINENFVSQTDNEIEEITMGPIAIFCNKMSYFWTLSVVASGVFTGMLPLVMGDRSIMPIQGWFPYDYTKSPMYEVSFAWQIFCQINLGLIYGASDMIFPNMTLIISQQFKILASNVKNCVYTAILKSGISKEIVLKFQDNLEKSSLLALMTKYEHIFAVLQSRTFRDTNHLYLSKNIRHHQMLLKSCEYLNQIMSLYLLVKVLPVTANMIFIVFTLLTTADQTMLVGLACYAFFGTTELFIYNYGGQILIENADILWPVYECPWYLCDLKFQKNFLFVQQRLTKSIQTKAGNYFTMSAPTFIAMMKSVFSYATVLKKVTVIEN